MSGSSAPSRALADVGEPSQRRPEDDPTRRVWLSVAGVQSRTGRGRRTVLEALGRGLDRRERGEPGQPGDLRGWQAPGTRGGTWSIHVDDVDAWVRGEAPAPVRGVA